MQKQEASDTYFKIQLCMVYSECMTCVWCTVSQLHWMYSLCKVLVSYSECITSVCCLVSYSDVWLVYGVKWVYDFCMVYS